jgi:hypothetical protein
MVASQHVAPSSFPCSPLVLITPTNIRIYQLAPEVMGLKYLHVVLALPGMLYDETCCEHATASILQCMISKHNSEPRVAQISQSRPHNSTQLSRNLSFMIPLRLVSSSECQI